MGTPVEAQNEQSATVVIQPDMLPLTLEAYARKTNQTIRAVRDQANKGHIPTIQRKKGATVYVNQAAMILSSLQAADWDVRVPLDQFSY
ncbi:hypothetical protein [Aliivibrio fischeri]|uniref:hypothetical protein n=1 Tax=Aliivibrio fischeri TaxID=668 RepID=UPI0007C47BED|nr:hypothetical protein [Aliivibrio fischeri]OCH44077.1 hypothetical protein A6E02_03430 [Aliivibrio fischeri]